MVVWLLLLTYEAEGPLPHPRCCSTPSQPPIALALSPRWLVYWRSATASSANPSLASSPAKGGAAGVGRPLIAVPIMLNKMLSPPSLRTRQRPTLRNGSVVCTAIPRSAPFRCLCRPLLAPLLPLSSPKHHHRRRLPQRLLPKTPRATIGGSRRCSPPPEAPSSLRRTRLPCSTICCRYL